MVAAAARASRRGAELTSKLLAFSRRQQLSPSEVDVGELIESLADMLRRTLEQSIRIEVTADAAGLRCEVDAGQLESALLNIAINSRDAMPDGGTLSFACAPCISFPPDVASDLGARARRGAFIEIVIRDTGEGMTESVRERVFEPFFTTKELGRGTGLGMSTVYGFVKQSRIDSARHRTGCRHRSTIYLPRRSTAGVGGPAAPRAATRTQVCWSRTAPTCAASWAVSGVHGLRRQRLRAPSRLWPASGRERCQLLLTTSRSAQACVELNWRRVGHAGRTCRCADVRLLVELRTPRRRGQFELPRKPYSEASSPGHRAS